MLPWDVPLPPPSHVAEGGVDGWTQTLRSAFCSSFWGLMLNLGSDPSFLQLPPCHGWFRLGNGSSAVQPARPCGSDDLPRMSFCFVPSPTALPTVIYTLP